MTSQRDEPASIADLDFGDDLRPLRLTLEPEQIAEYVHSANQVAPRFLSDEGGQQDGLPGQIAPGNLSLAIFSRLLEQAAPGAQVQKISATFRAFVRPAVAMIASGVVTDVEDRDGGKLFECDLMLETEIGDRLVTGTGTVFVAL